MFSTYIFIYRESSEFLQVPVPSSYFPHISSYFPSISSYFQHNYYFLISFSYSFFFVWPLLFFSQVFHILHNIISKIFREPAALIISTGREWGFPKFKISTFQNDKYSECDVIGRGGGVVSKSNFRILGGAWIFFKLCGNVFTNWNLKIWRESNGLFVRNL